MDTIDVHFLRTAVIAYPQLTDDPAVVVLGVDGDPAEPPQPQRQRETGCVWELYHRGSGSLRDDNGHHPIGPGTVLIRLPGILQMIDFEPGPRYAKAYCSLSVACGQALQTLGLIRAQRPLWLCRDPALAWSLHHRLLADCRGPHPPRGPRLWQRLIEVFACWREEPESRTDPLQQAADLLARDIRAELEPQAVAAIIGMSYHAFRRAFRKTYGMAPLAWRLRARMQRACALLADHSVGAVAEACGYRTLYAFSIQFRRSMGMAPSHWQARLHDR